MAGRVHEGRPFGKRRTLTVDVALGHEPSQVVLNQTQHLTWEALGAAKRYRIRLPDLPADAPLELLIR